jgi:transposase
MARKRVKHLGGSKGKVFSERLQCAGLDSTVIVPIEIGKRDHKALVADYFGAILKEPFEFPSSEEGIRFLHHTISKVCKEHQMESVILGMEATGHYYKAPAASLSEMGYPHLFVLNPVTTAQCRKAGLIWSKTDDIDLQAIGQALVGGYGTLYRPEQPIWEDLRELCRYRRFQVRHQTALKNKTHAVLDRLLPGITQLELFKDPHLWHPASLDFLAKYPNVDQIARLRPRYLLQFFQRRGRRVSSEAGYQLIRWTQHTFPQAPPAQGTREAILKALLLELNQRAAQLCQLEIDLLGYLVQIPAVLLLSLDYVGPIRAGEFAGELTPFEQYPNSRALIKGAGLDPLRFQSATRESKDHPTSHNGSKHLRYISIEIGDALMRQNAYFAAFANNLLHRGKSTDCACVATATRFIRVAFSMIKEQQPFQPSNGLGVAKDPLGKIAYFLQTHYASDRIEPYLQRAQRYLGPTYPKEAA